MAAIKTTGTFRRSAAHTRIHRCSTLEIHDIEWRAELERRTVLGWPGVCCPDDRTWQSNSIFTTKFKFSFVKSSLGADKLWPTFCGMLHPGDTHPAHRCRTAYSAPTFPPIAKGARDNVLRH